MINIKTTNFKKKEGKKKKDAILNHDQHQNYFKLLKKSHPKP